MYERLTWRHVRVLAALRVERRAERVARRLEVELSTVRTHIHVLYDLTDRHSIPELLAWWDEHDLRYRRFVAERGGIDMRKLREPTA
ncbi:MAG: hypothetical protein ACM3S1_07190 [Hyphomicrobiales bacterium]